MSRIFTHWKCDNCKAEFDNWVSFGHPDEDFDYKWKCPECNHTNVLHVEAWPDDILSTITSIGDTPIKFKLRQPTISFVNRRNQ